MARLGSYVHVTDADGAIHVFGPDSDVPAWAEKAIDNEKAWAEPRADSGGPPPRAGKGSGRDAWAEYADANGVSVDDDATRDDIIAAVEAAGVPTE